MNTKPHWDVLCGQWLLQQMWNEKPPSLCLETINLRVSENHYRACNSVLIHASHTGNVSPRSQPRSSYLYISLSVSAHSLVMSFSICFLSSSLPFLCSGMCTSAGFHTSVVSTALLLACVCVFMFHVPTCRSWDRRRGIERGRRTHGQDGALPLGITHPDFASPAAEC